MEIIKNFKKDIISLLESSKVNPLRYFSLMISYYENNLNEILSLIEKYGNVDTLELEKENYELKIKIINSLRNNEFYIFII